MPLRPLWEKVAAEGGRVRGRAALWLEWRRSDDFENSPDDLPVLELDFSVPEAQDTKSFRRQPGVSQSITFGIVKRTVRLDHQPMSHADKVQNVGPKRDLPPELQTFQPSVSEQLPQQAFGLRRSAAQSASLRNCGGASHGSG